MPSISQPVSREESERLIRERSEAVTSPALCPEPLVSVCCQTFNHRPFIAQAIKGILAQKTDFSFELVIGEDASNDGTLEIVREYQKRYPDRIAVFRSTENLGRHTGSGRLNFLRSLGHCRGRYIAVIEGDDFWTDPGKLQRQVDYLESHSSAAGCFTGCRIVDERGDVLDPRPFWNEPYEEHYDQRGCLVHLKSAYGTATLLFRREVIDAGLPGYFWSAGGDFLLDLAITEHGSLDHLPFETAAYRIHSGGIWQGTQSPSHHLTGLARLRALGEDPEMASRYAAEIGELRADFYRRLLKLRMPPAGESRMQIPVRWLGGFAGFIVPGSFDLGKDEADCLETWLRMAGEASWGGWSVLMVVVCGEDVDVVWSRSDGQLPIASIKTNTLGEGVGGSDWVLPDLSHFDGMDSLSGRSVPKGLSTAWIEAMGTLREPLLANLSELKKVRRRLEEIENSRYWRAGLALKNFWRRLFPRGGFGRGARAS